MDNGFSANTPKNIVVDQGKIYFGFASLESLGTLVGATRGGNKFTYTPEKKDMGFDGAPGPVKGMQRILGGKVTLDVNVLEWTLDNIKASTVGLTSSAFPATGTKTHDLIVGSFNIADAEYRTVAIVGKRNDNAQPIVIVVKNALATSPLDIDLKEKDEAVDKITFEGHYDSTDLTKPPFEIYYPVVA